MSLNTVFKLAAAAGAAIGGAAIANAAVAASVPKLEPWFDGEQAWYFWRGRRVAYTVRGSGRPVLLLHSVHAAASSYEWRHNFETLSQSYRVHAVDLLGFGMSDRPETRYHAELYVELVVDLLRDLFTEPPVVVASSLACAYVAAAAYRTPQHVASLVLVSPTGERRVTRAWAPLEMAIESSLEVPVIGQSLFNVFVSEASIRYFLREQVFASESAIDEAAIRQMYATSHQPGARHAPAAYVGGELNLPFDESFGRISQPVLLVFGSEARVTPRTDAEFFTRLHPAARVEVAEGAGLLPHDERAGWFNSTIGSFLE